METGPGSLSALRLANRQRLVEVLQDGRQISQAELARRTGLSPATVSGLVRGLGEEGLLAVAEGVSNGRRSRMVKLAPQRRPYGIGIDVGRTHVRVVAGTAAGDVLAESAAPLGSMHDVDAALGVIRSLVGDVREAAGLDADHVSGIAMGVPGPVDAVTGAVAETAVLPGWSGVPLREKLRHALGHQVVVDSDANLGAIALARGRDCQDPLVFITVSSGIRAGVAVRGQVLRGRSGTVGEIGHLTLDSGLSTVCRCGRRGCLETISSVESVRSALGSALRRDLELDDVLDLLSQGNPVATQILEDAGDMLGRCLGWLAVILDPAEIALDGPLVVAGEVWLRAVRRGFRRAVLPGTADKTPIVLAPLGDRTVAVGALLAGLHEGGVLEGYSQADPARVGRRGGGRELTRSARAIGRGHDEW